MEAITREEKLMSGQQLEPITRKELFLAKAAGMDVQTPEPITREEMFLSQISGSSGGSTPVVEPLSVTENGTYTAPSGVDGYNPVTVNVAGSGDDGSFKAVIERTATNPTLPSDLIHIGKYAFYDCTNLALTSLPDGVTMVGEYAFYGCTNLALTSLPASLMNLYSGAFQKCTKLAEITFKGKPNSIASDAFYDCDNLRTINVPWAEGEVSGAPWGATNATINYNYTGG